MIKERNWYKYHLIKDYIHSKKSTERLEATFDQLKLNKKKDNLLFNYNYFINTHLHPIYNYLKKKLHGNCLSIGSGKAHLEYHLSKIFKILPTDINDSFINFNKKIKINKFNILNCNNNEIKKLGKFDCIIIPGIEYLFTNKQLKKFFSNLKKLSNKNTDIFFCFRSRYTIITNIIDHIICPLEIFLTKYIKFIKYKGFRIKKIHHGFRRKDNEIEKIITNYFLIKSVYRDMFSLEYKRSILFRILKIDKILKCIFFKSHPYLNIYHLKNL
jgi:hypothetical protein